MKEKIGFFGGCFNPPSKVHVNLAKELIKNNRVDKVIFVPVGDCYPKEDLIPAIHRYNMLKLAVSKYDNIEVDDIELILNRHLYAVDIFKLISKKYLNKDIYFIMGSDNFNNIDMWKEYNEIKGYNYIVLKRNDEDINSTQIRTMLHTNNDDGAKKVLQKEVFKYIKENNLYKK